MGLQHVSVTHPRDVSCPQCGAETGSPCRTRTGKELKDVHCTERIVGPRASHPPAGAPKAPKKPRSRARPREAKPAMTEGEPGPSKAGPASVSPKREEAGQPPLF